MTSVPSPSDSVLSLVRISKRFGRVQALGGVDFALAAGTVHALLGENGAGKSTLMHIAYGLMSPDAGEIRLDGHPVVIASPRIARSHGIGMVHQHFTSVPALTVTENIQLAGGSVSCPSGRAGALANRFLARLPLHARVEELSVGLKQQLEIVKALAGRVRILLLDEPTAVLAPSEIDYLLGALREFAAQGGAVVLITHKLEEALRAADRVTVLRRGHVTLEAPIAGLSAAELAAAMIGEARQGEEGREEARKVRHEPGGPSVPVVSLDRVSVPGLGGRGPGIREVSLSIAPGEIVGVAAIEGNGQRELMLTVAGLIPPAAGRLEVRQPVALVPEDRTTEGLVPELTLTENLVLGSGPQSGWIRGPWIDWGLARRRTGDLIEAYEVRAPSTEVAAGLLSGGNQQKLVLSRALSQEPAVLVVENPTRGLDIRGTAAIHSRLRKSAQAGIAVLVYSSDLDEVLELADRVVVVAQGRLREGPLERTAIGRMMLGLESMRGDEGR